jgi:hypothetical protein
VFERLLEVRILFFSWSPLSYLNERYLHPLFWQDLWVWVGRFASRARVSAGRQEGTNSTLPPPHVWLAQNRAKWLESVYAWLLSAKTSLPSEVKTKLRRKKKFFRHIWKHTHSKKNSSCRIIIVARVDCCHKEINFFFWKVSPDCVNQHGGLIQIESVLRKEPKLT